MDANNRVHREELQLLIDDLRRMRQQVATELESHVMEAAPASAVGAPATGSAVMEPTVVSATEAAVASATESPVVPVTEPPT